MQPMLVLRAAQPGILYLNGCFAGELGAGSPLLRPVNGQGPVYLDYRPLNNACQAMARRLVFSGGAPMVEAAESAENLSIVIWPGNIAEIELTPPRSGTGPQRFQMAGHQFMMDESSLSCDGHILGSLPEGAQPPQLATLAGGIALHGPCADGQYLLSCDSAFRKQTGFLRAAQIEIEGGHIRAVASNADLVGHATLENWQLTPEGLTLLSSEPAWAHGAPRWPKTPQDTAMAAVEALLAGMESEAEGYLSPTLRDRNPLAEIRNRCDLCVEMRFAPPDPRPCVGLLRMEGSNLARVQPLYYHAVPSDGPQGAYLLDGLEFA